jgi:phosphoglycolate phosphatase-like HAD superfamily hydrolase
LVGDKIGDIEAGNAAGVGCCVLVLSGHAPDRKDLKKVDIVFEDLPAVADAIVKNQLCLNETKKSANWDQH